MASLDKILVRQQDQSDCGVACLATIIKYYGGEYSFERLREISGTTKQGTTLLGLCQAAKECGFDAEGLEAEQVKDLKELKEPVILLVTLENNFHHYVVLFHYNQNIVVGDPSKGVIQYTEENLSTIWKSKALLQLHPNQKFEKKEVTRNSKLNLVLELITADIGILISSLFLGIIIALLSLTSAVFSQKLIDTILPSSDKTKLLFSLILVTILLLARVGISYVRGFLIIGQSHAFNYRLINRFYGRVLRLPKTFFDSRKTGDFIARMNDTSRIQTVISVISGNLVIDLLIIILSCAFTFYYSTTIGIAIVACIPFYIVLAYALNKPIVRGQNELMISYAYCESHFIDSIQGISEIKSKNKQFFFDGVNRRIYGTFLDKTLALGKIGNLFSALSGIISILFTVAVFSLCSWMVMEKNLQLGGMVALLSITGNILPAIGSIISANIQLQEAKIAFERMFEFSNAKPEYVHKVDEHPSLTTSDWNALTINNITFGFPGRSELLNNISIKLRRGEMISILGESGSGKSTILQILQRFYHCESGEIMFNGLPWCNINTYDWRNIIGVVPQDVKVFNGSLLYNICLSDSIDDLYKVVEFSRKLGLNKFFEKLPQQYLTPVGEDGINLSGGQKQLLSLARALYRRPQILLLDEPTAAMDAETERYIIQILLELKSEMGIILVTHKLQTAKKCDRIYILENRTIAISGNHSSLLLTNNFYSKAFTELNE